jgi:hypothetical protein
VSLAWSLKCYPLSEPLKSVKLLIWMVISRSCCGLLASPLADAFKSVGGEEIA